MNPCKPLYPPPWWSGCDAPPAEDLFPRDDLIVRYVGTDCEGNALFSVKIRRRPCPPPLIQPRNNHR